MSIHYTHNDENRAYTVEEIAYILKVCKRSAYKLVKSNVFNTVRIGNSIRVSRQSFDKWYNQNH